ncbi:MAG TPA: hypothetical protein VK674_04845 [Candidatus Limnocylindria bacterium]|nr:hypothetical protein [Candidatus Limnocylindria bacterium]
MSRLTFAVVPDLFRAERWPSAAVIPALSLPAGRQAGIQNREITFISTGFRISKLALSLTGGAE